MKISIRMVLVLQWVLAICALSSRDWLPPGYQWCQVRFVRWYILSVFYQWNNLVTCSLVLEPFNCRLTWSIQFSVIGLGVWSIIERDSVEAVFLYTVGTSISVIIGRVFLHDFHNMILYGYLNRIPFKISFLFGHHLQVVKMTQRNWTEWECLISQRQQ